jgi:hypothetical protein
MACKLITFIAAILGLLNLTACNAGPCRIEVNGICYDRPKSSNPPLSARFEAIDADTGKPLPGVMISFHWKTFLPSGQPDQCARNVIGETDANGKFGNTAKDGSWMFTQVQMFKAGWERIYFDRLIGQTFISHTYQVQIAEIGMYPAWESQLKQLGYVLDSRAMGPVYRKRFELGDQYERIMTAEWQPEGLRTYWVKMRGFPSELTPNQIGTRCFNRELGKTDPNAESVGFDQPKFERNHIELERSKHALQAICDNKWDSVPASYVWSPTARLVGDAGSAFVENDPQLKTLLPDFYGDHPISNSGFSRPLTSNERLNYCAAAYKNLDMNHE